MNQNLWKPAAMKARGGHAMVRRTFWPKFFLYPAVVLGALMMVVALRVGWGHALEGHSWQKPSPTLVYPAFSPDHPQKWNKPLMTLTSDSDDDDDDSDGDDCPTT
jgi:hypothetical protein